MREYLLVATLVALNVFQFAAKHLEPTQAGHPGDLDPTLAQAQHDDSPADNRGQASVDTPRSQKRRRPVRPRIDPVAKADWTEPQKALLAPYEQSGRLYNVFTTMAQHPDLARDWLTFGSHILRRNSLPARDREILILRIGWLCQSEYEWAQHVRIGKTVGLTDADIERITQGPDAPDLNESDRLLLRAVDELHNDACITDAAWNALAKTYNMQQMMDLVFTVGQYNLVSMALNSFGVQLDEGLDGFPK